MRLLRLIVQLHHGLVGPDHAGRGGLPSTGHGAGCWSGCSAALAPSVPGAPAGEMERR